MIHSGESEGGGSGGDGVLLFCSVLSIPYI